MEADFGSGAPEPKRVTGELIEMQPGDAIKLVFTMEFEETGGDQNAAMGESVTVGFTFNAFTDYECP